MFFTRRSLQHALVRHLEKPAHAKNAFNQTLYRHNSESKYGVSLIDDPTYWNPDFKRTAKFDEQDQWEIIELKHESQDKLDIAEDLLIHCLNHISGQLKEDVLKFLEGVDAD